MLRTRSLTALALVCSLTAGAAGAQPAPAGARAFPQPPLPETMSAEARAELEASAKAVSGQAGPAKPMSVPEMRAFADAVQKRVGEPQLARYNVSVTKTEFGGLPALVFESRAPKPERRKRLLLNFHGGGFIVDSGSMTENVRLADLSGTRVVSVLYRLAPEHPFPAAVDDAAAAYRAALREYRPEDIAIYGTSAGAILTAQLLARIKQEGLPMPGAAGAFSLTADFSRSGDSAAYVGGVGGSSTTDILSAYAGARARTDPMLSPLFSDLRGWPPTLVLASTRDALLSQSAIFHRALLRAGVEADLIVFEGLPHAFWAGMDIPETTEAFEAMNRFFDAHLGKGAASRPR